MDKNKVLTKSGVDKTFNITCDTKWIHANYSISSKKEYKLNDTGLDEGIRNLVIRS